jgi:hypothetical protein
MKQFRDKLFPQGHPMFLYTNQMKDVIKMGSKTYILLIVI